MKLIFTAIASAAMLATSLAVSATPAAASETIQIKLDGDVSQVTGTLTISGKQTFNGDLTLYDTAPDHRAAEFQIETNVQTFDWHELQDGHSNGRWIVRNKTDSPYSWIRVNTRACGSVENGCSSLVHGVKHSNPYTS